MSSYANFKPQPFRNSQESDNCQLQLPNDWGTPISVKVYGKQFKALLQTLPWKGKEKASTRGTKFEDLIKYSN